MAGWNGERIGKIGKYLAKILTEVSWHVFVTADFVECTNERWRDGTWAAACREAPSADMLMLPLTRSVIFIFTFSFLIYFFFRFRFHSFLPSFWFQCHSCVFFCFIGCMLWNVIFRLTLVLVDKNSCTSPLFISRVCRDCLLHNKMKKMKKWEQSKMQHWLCCNKEKKVRKDQQKLNK